MASGALFGSASTRSSSKNLVEFKAGKMYMKGKMVNPDKRKGLVYIYRSEDALIHFCWKDRSTGSVEDDLIIFPDDCEFKRINQCTTGRVYILKFKTGKKFFFWLQEPKTDKDEENCRKVNEMLNNPPAPGSSGGGGGGGSGGGIPPELAAALGGSHGADGGLQNLLANMDQQQLLQLLSSAGGSGGSIGSMLGTARPATTQSVPSARVPSTTPASTPAVPASASPSQSSSRARPDTTSSSSQQSIQLTDLQSILSTMNIPEQQQASSVDLSEVLTHESMAPILANEEVQERLKPFLPEGGTLLARDFADISTTIQSPQFQQAAGVFSAAFQSGQLGPLMAQFGLGKEATEAATAGDLEAFAKALSKVAVEESSVDPPKDEDESMSLD
ncbi:proteasomal ubiquitin receptor ADRM1-like [Anneissia japonica]|uniref:proteasomal ubiquitin receptor ADRM1-like n=1 Tax=Anneissia japonica TaxID=1529436 RepID=UPI00142557DB|nr:proteasomal ubiquitin receptor ADRM1-like [Anneissia japonica]